MLLPHIVRENNFTRFKYIYGKKKLLSKFSENLYVVKIYNHQFCKLIMIFIKSTIKKSFLILSKLYHRCFSMKKFGKNKLQSHKTENIPFLNYILVQKHYIKLSIDNQFQKIGFDYKPHLSQSPYKL